MKRFSLATAMVALAMSAHAHEMFLPPGRDYPQRTRGHTSNGNLRRAMMVMPSYAPPRLRNMARRVRQGRASKCDLRAAVIAHAISVIEAS